HAPGARELGGDPGRDAPRRPRADRAGEVGRALSGRRDRGGALDPAGAARAGAATPAGGVRALRARERRPSSIRSTADPRGDPRPRALAAARAARGPPRAPDGAAGAGLARPLRSGGRPRAEPLPATVG